MFQSRKPRKQRVRKIDDEEDMEIDDTTEEAPVVTPKTKKEKKKKDRKKTKTALSFGDDEIETDSTEFVVKKSNRSRKLAEKLRNEVMDEERKENKGSYWGGGTYTATEITNLKHSQKSIPTDSQPTILNSEELDKVRTDAGVKSVFRERILDKMGGSSIPDANAIHEARKKREEARRHQKMDDTYIPINKTKPSNKGGRLQEHEDDPDDKVIKMEGVRSNGQQLDDIDVGRDCDDESVKKWESDLIKGSNIPGHVPMHPMEEFARRAQQIPVGQRMKNKLGDLKERLEENLGNLKINSNHQEVDLSPVDELELAERYTYFNEMKAWLKDYTNFINAKMPEIDSWHKGIRDLQAEKASVLLRRRQLDIKDAGLQYTFNAPKHGNTDLASDVQARIREREARRTRRKMDRQLKKILNHNPGDSSDDEMDPENSAVFAEKFCKLESERHALFADVVDDYIDSRLLLNRFNKWRESFPRWYKVCFIEECAGAVILPVIRVELAGWTPTGTPLATTKTVENVLRFCTTPDNPEIMILPYVIGKYPLESILWWIENVFDPLSRVQTKSIVDLLESDLMRNLSWATSCDERMKSIGTKIHERISRSILEDIYVPLLAPDVSDFTIGHGLFFQRQWNAALKLIRNCLEFRNIFSPQTLQTLVLEKLINGQLLLRLSNLPKDAKTLSRAGGIIELLPSSWFKYLTDVTLPGLRSLSLYIAKLASKKDLYKQGKEVLKKIKATEQLQLAKHQLPIDPILG